MPGGQVGPSGGSGGSGGGGGEATLVLETPTGAVNGINTAFVFTAPPVAVFRNGVLVEAADYSVVGNTVTFDTAPPAPESGSGGITGFTQ